MKKPTNAELEERIESLTKTLHLMRNELDKSQNEARAMVDTLRDNNREIETLHNNLEAIRAACAEIDTIVSAARVLLCPDFIYHDTSRGYTKRKSIDAFLAHLQSHLSPHLHRCSTHPPCSCQ
jgi:hypothetical protein